MRIRQSTLGVKLAWLSCAIFVIIAIIGPNITPHDPINANLKSRLLSPSAVYWFGTDSAGLDVFSRVIAAARIDLTIAILGVLLSVFVGVFLGLSAGYLNHGKSRWISRSILVITEMVQTFPVFVLAMALVAFSGQRVENIIFAIAFVNAPFYIRLVSVKASALRKRAFVEAAYLAGIPVWKVILRHILPNSMTPVIVQLSVNIGAAVLLTAGLSFVGAGVRAPTPEWGLMIAQGSLNVVTGQWWPALFPGLALTLVVFSLAIVGNDLEERLDPRRVSSSQIPYSTKSNVFPSKSNETSLLSVSQLSINISDQNQGIPILKSVSLKIDEGELVAIVGESGAGKSTLANALMCQLRPGLEIVEGQVTFENGRYCSNKPMEWTEVRGKKIGYIVSNPSVHLDPLKRIGDQIADAYQRHCFLNRQDAKKNAISALIRMKIPDPERMSEVYPHQLSGGMAQRVVIAISLASDPKLLIADEPVSGLDVTLQHEIMKQISIEASRRGSTLICITHDLGLAAAYCNRVVVMYQGKIIEDSPKKIFFKEPQHFYSRQLLSAARGKRVMKMDSDVLVEFNGKIDGTLT